MSLEARARTDARPFRALRFHPDRVDPADVVTPPYDVITPAQRAGFLARSPFNVAHLILPEPGQEAGARRALERFREQGVLVEDERPTLSWLEQEYTGPDGARHRRGGVVAALRLEDYGEGGVRPHERTLSGPKQNRLALLRAVRANLSPIFGIYDDPERRVSTAVAPALRDAAPLLDVSDADGTRHRLWRIDDPAIAEAVADALSDTAVVIADGHHRYETALAYRAEQRAAGGPAGERPYDFAPVFLANRADPGLEIFPTHRVVTGIDPELHASLEQRLQATFDLERVPGTPDQLYQRLLAAPRERRAFALWSGSGRPGTLALLRSPADLDRALPNASQATRALDVAALGALVLHGVLGLDAEAVAHTDRIRYARSAVAAAATVEAEPGGTAVALLLRPPLVEDVEAVAAAGETMPQKSTYFYPKVPDGLVFLPLDG